MHTEPENIPTSAPEQNTDDAPSADMASPEAASQPDEAMRSYRDETATLRATSLASLRRLGVQKIEASYSGYGDSGQVDDVTLEPAPDRMPDGLAEQLDDLVWRVVYQTNPGFEINDGGRGEFHWSLADDCITINHCSYYTAEEHSRHEDV